MKIYRSWILKISRFGVSSEPDEFFTTKEQAEKDNQHRLSKLEKENDLNNFYSYFKNGVDTIEVKEN